MWNQNQNLKAILHQKNEIFRHKLKTWMLSDIETSQILIKEIKDLNAWRVMMKRLKVVKIILDWSIGSMYLLNPASFL